MIVFFSYGFAAFFFFWFMYSLPRVDGTMTKTVLRFMSLETGGAHPLAREPDIQLGTDLSVNLLDVRADVIGDQIVLVLVDLRIHNPKSDAIYLVDWKRGRMTLVSHASCMQHGLRAAQKRPFSSQFIFLPTFRYTVPQTGRMKARSRCSQKSWYSFSSATHRA
jgi:hypothetical protein